MIHKKQTKTISQSSIPNIETMPNLCINPIVPAAAAHATANIENMPPRRSDRIFKASKATDAILESMSPRRSNRVTVTASAFARAAASATKNKPARAPIKKRSTKSVRKPSSKRRKTSLKIATIQPTAATAGVIDREANIEGKIVTLDNDPADVMLVLADPAKNIDKFFIIQLISLAEGSYAVYNRWGRTGTVGQALKQDFDELDDAVKLFETKFKEKTGLAWAKRNDPTIEGTKYRFIQQNFGEKEGGYVGAKWQYWVDDGVDGKMSSWYDYSTTGSSQVERLYQEHVLNGRLTNRLVESGFFSYNVNLDQMTQTNMKHPSRTTRRIRRLEVAGHL